MNWYITKLVFQIITQGNSGIQQFDEQLRLINATNFSEAFEKAKAIGTKEQEEFLNAEKQVVKWQFVDVSELIEIKSFTDGMEMFSGIKEIEATSNYIYTVKQKASSIKNRVANQAVLSN